MWAVLRRLRVPAEAPTSLCPPSNPPTPPVNIYAGAFLIPVGVMLYTAHGGLKATYLASWGHGARQTRQFLLRKQPAGLQ